MIAGVTGLGPEAHLPAQGRGYGKRHGNLIENLDPVPGDGDHPSPGVIATELDLDRHPTIPRGQRLGITGLILDYLVGGKTPRVTIAIKGHAAFQLPVVKHLRGGGCVAVAVVKGVKGNRQAATDAFLCERNGCLQVRAEVEAEPIRGRGRAVRELHLERGHQMLDPLPLRNRSPNRAAVPVPSRRSEFKIAGLGYCGGIHNQIRLFHGIEVGRSAQIGAKIWSGLIRQAFAQERDLDGAISHMVPRESVGRIRNRHNFRIQWTGGIPARACLPVVLGNPRSASGTTIARLGSTTAAGVSAAPAATTASSAPISRPSLTAAAPTTGPTPGVFAPRCVAAGVSVGIRLATPGDQRIAVVWAIVMRAAIREKATATRTTPFARRVAKSATIPVRAAESGIPIVGPASITAIIGSATTAATSDHEAGTGVLDDDVGPAATAAAARAVAVLASFGSHHADPDVQLHTLFQPDGSLDSGSLAALMGVIACRTTLRTADLQQIPAGVRNLPLQAGGAHGEIP